MQESEASRGPCWFSYSVAPKTGTDDYSTALGNSVKTAGTWIRQDMDGAWMVGFLGEGIPNALREVPDFASPAKRAYAFVRSEAETFRKAGNAKLSLRYYLLQEYMESRLPLWGIGQ